MFVNLGDYSPAKDGVSLDTEVFNLAIKELAGQGGGTLNIESGKYLLGAIYLENNICLHLESGAELIASPNYTDFLQVESSVLAEQSLCGFIFAKGKKNITISGYGVINGNARFYHAEHVDDFGYRKPNLYRIRTILLEDCENIQISGITIKNAAMWTLHCISCQIGKIHNIKILNDFRYTNTDAIDLDGCQNFIVDSCFLQTADDGICLKTSQKPENIDRPCENIIVSNCIIESHSSALKIGTESYNDFNNITFSNCIITNSNRGIALVSRDGGNINNINVYNINITTRFTYSSHWGRADPIYITTSKRSENTLKLGRIQYIRFYNIHILAEGAINFHSADSSVIRDITLTNIIQHQLTSDSGERGTFDLRPPCNPLKSDNKGINNAYYVPEGETRPYGVYSYPNGIPAAFISNINQKEVDFINCRFTQDDDIQWSNEKIQFI